MKKAVITVARQFGSLGEEVCQTLSKLLGIPFYDRELITLAAQGEDALDEAVLESADEKPTNSFLYSIAMGASTGLFSVAAGSHLSMPLNDKVFIRQSAVIRSLADKESCIILGRCCDYVLRQHPDRISVLLYSDLAARQKTVAEKQGISESDALAIINKQDKRKVTYYNFYTGEKWGDFKNFDLAINTARLGAEGTARVIADFVRAAKGDD